MQDVVLELRDLMRRVAALEAQDQKTYTYVDKQVTKLTTGIETAADGVQKSINGALALANTVESLERDVDQLKAQMSGSESSVLPQLAAIKQRLEALAKRPSPPSGTSAAPVEALINANATKETARISARAQIIVQIIVAFVALVSLIITVWMSTR